MALLYTHWYMLISETVQWFKNIFDLNCDASITKENFQIGAVEDIEKYKEQHPEAKLLGITKCDSLDTVQKLLEMMREEGFPSDTVDDKALFVYLRKK